MEFLSFSEKLILQNNLDNLRDLELLSISDISRIVNRPIKTAIWKSKEIAAIVERDVKILKAYSIRVCPFDDESYPVILKDIYNPPYILFVRGNIFCLNQTSVALVGTRKTCQEAAEHAFNFSKDLAEMGYVVVSGLAIGIDTAVHKGCLKGNGLTVGVLACGLDALYPPSNKYLGKMILESGGCLISEYPPATEAFKWHFPARNRIISGISKAVGVIDAYEKSGAMITADFAIEQNRDLFFHTFCVNKNIAKKESLENNKICRYVDEGASVFTNASELDNFLRF